MATIDQVISRFESQLGTVENPLGSNLIKYNDWYYGSPGVPGAWCGTFVSWCFYNEGLPLSATIERGFAYTPSGAAWFIREGRWTTVPSRGHVVFFDFPGDGVNRISHVGIVTRVNANGSIETIEGNTDERGSRTGGKVMRRTRSVGIVGYGVPAYSTVSPKPAPSEPLPQEDDVYPMVIWSSEGSGALLIGASGKVLFKSGASLDAFKAQGVKEVKGLDPADFNAIPTVGSAFPT